MKIIQSDVIYLKKKVEGFDNLIKHIYLSKIIKVILTNLIKKYYQSLIIYKENGFINFKFKKTENLTSEKEKHYHML